MIILVLPFFLFCIFLVGKWYVNLIQRIPQFLSERGSKDLISPVLIKIFLM